MAFMSSDRLRDWQDQIQQYRQALSEAFGRSSEPRMAFNRESTPISNMAFNRESTPISNMAFNRTMTPNSKSWRAPSEDEFLSYADSPQAYMDRLRPMTRTMSADSIRGYNLPSMTPSFAMRGDVYDGNDDMLNRVRQRYYQARLEPARRLAQQNPDDESFWALYDYYRLGGR